MFGIFGSNNKELNSDNENSTKESGEASENMKHQAESELTKDEVK